MDFFASDLSDLSAFEMVSAFSNMLMYSWAIRFIWGQMFPAGEPLKALAVGMTVQFKGSRWSRRKQNLAENEEGEVLEVQKGKILVAFASGEKLLRASQLQALMPQDEFDDTILEEVLQPRKQLKSAYALWLFAGLFGAHHFYLGNITRGATSLLTLNFLGLGWLVDLMLMPIYVRSYNRSHSGESAPPDGTGKAIAWKLPISVFLLIAMPVLTVGYGPWAMNRVGLVDIERLNAGTQVSPYEILGLGRGASLKDAKLAHRQKSLQYHPDKNPGCGRDCEMKMAEIHKAFDAIKRRQAPPPEDKTFKGQLKSVGEDWWNIIQVLDETLKDMVEKTK